MNLGQLDQLPQLTTTSPQRPRAKANLLNRSAARVKEPLSATATFEQFHEYERFDHPQKQLLFKEEDKNNYLALVKMANDKVISAVLVVASSLRKSPQSSYQTSLYNNQFKVSINHPNMPRICYTERAVIHRLTEALANGNQKETLHGFSSNFQADLSDYVSFAKQHGASDIHIEGRKNGGRVRVRINGDLISLSENIPWQYSLDQIRYLYNSLTKGGDQSFDNFKAQNGFIEALPLPGLDDIRLRVATTQEVDGVDMVLRLLPMSVMQKATPLNELGYTNKQVKDLMDGLNLPYGLVLIAGTTGSGKSTTLANLIMNRIQTDFYSKIITIENPVEFRLPGITQIPVKDSGGSEAWSEAIKSCMRLDPDLLMVGEIRDALSARSIYNAVLTGHPSLSTIHASNGLAILDRLEVFELERSILSSPDFLAIIAKQDLLKKPCAQCCYSLAEVVATPSLLLKRKSVIKRLNRVSDYYQQSIDKLRFINDESGCSLCQGYTPGVVGRTVCAEVIKPDREMRRLFKHISSAADLKSYWLNQYYAESQLDIAWKKICRGLADPIDVEKKLGPIDSIIKRNNEYGVRSHD